MGSGWCLVGSGVNTSGWCLVGRVKGSGWCLAGSKVKGSGWCLFKVLLSYAGG